MDTPDSIEEPSPAELQDELELADPADAPEIAERLAQSLTDSLDKAVIDSEGDDS